MSCLNKKQVTIVKKLEAAGKGIAMAGDDVNDVPALARSQVGIALCTGTEKDGLNAIELF
jgi:P-type E1-E2 ATPase